MARWDWMVPYCELLVALVRLIVGCYQSFGSYW
jgi:hypothetical protein